MIHMRVGGEDPADRARRGRQDGIGMALIGRAGVDHRPLVSGTPTDQIGVGAGSGHDSGVIGRHTHHVFRQAHRLTRHDRIRGRAMALRIELAHLGPAK